MTLILAVSADGEALPIPTIILPVATLPPLADEVTASFNITGSDSGWITIPIWSKWIVDVFIPHVIHKRDKFVKAGGVITSPQYGRAILFLDSHSSRLDEYAHMQLEANGIRVSTIPSHSSHILQPLDCGINNHFKHALRNLSFLKMIRMDHGLPDYRNSILYCTKAALSDAQNFLRIQRAFECCGLWPWRPERVTGDPTKVTPSLVVPATPDRPTIIQQISGTLLSPSIIRNHRLEKEAEEELIELTKLAKAAERADKVRSREVDVAAKAAARIVRETHAMQKRAEKDAKVEKKRQRSLASPPTAMSTTPSEPAITEKRPRKKAKLSL